MENKLRRRVAPGASLSRALLPLALGLTRRMLLRAGVSSEERRLAGISTHYYRHAGRPGSDPAMPLVLIHGIADNALTWSMVLGDLATIGPVFAVDLPGFGLSGRPASRPYATIAEHVAVIAALLREVVGGPALLVGNSMGGWIAARLALEAPELVRGIVLLDPGGALLEGRASWEPFVSTVAVPDLNAVRLIYRQMFGRVPAPLYLAQHSFRELFARESVQQFVASAVAAADAEDVAAAGFFTAAELRRIGRPAALLWGDRDTFLPAGSFEFFRDNLPGARVQTLNGVGHLPQHEAPREVARFVQAFAEGVQLTTAKDEGPKTKPEQSAKARLT